jgi:hypothetical protein
MQEHERPGIMRRREQLTTLRGPHGNDLDQLPKVVSESGIRGFESKDSADWSVQPTCQRFNTVCGRSSSIAKFNEGS